MKIKITVSPGEERAARLLVAFAKALLPGSRVKESDRYPPFKHIYVTSKIPANPHGDRESA